jgi:Type VI secretion system VasI, EvfG, VC_A0118
MSNPAIEPGQAASPPPAVGAPPAGAAPAVAAAKPRAAVSPLVILFGSLAALAAVAFALMSRGVATPQASAASPPASRPAPVARAAEPIAPSRWTNGPQWVSDRKSAAFELKSSNRVNVWMGQVQPLLVVRCTQNRTEAFVYTETAARIEPGMDDRAVRVRFDDEPFVDERWPDSEEHKGLFAPNGATFTQRLMNAHTLRFQFTPHNAETAEVQFSVAGLREVIEPVQKKCGWK